MLRIIPTSRFQKDPKRIMKRGYDLSLQSEIVNKLAKEEPLPERIWIINLAGIGRVVASATLLQIGC